MTSPKRPESPALRLATHLAMGACSLVALAACHDSDAAERSPAEPPGEREGPGTAADGEVAVGSTAVGAPTTSAAATAVEPRATGAATQTARPERAVPGDVPRVYAKTRNVWIRATPSSRKQWIGFLWIGNSVKLRSPDPVSGPGCETWYAIEPRGYVCVDGSRATLDANDPVLQGLFALAPNPELPTPHPFYGESLDAQRYHRLPTEMHQRAREWDYRFQMGRIENARSGGPVHSSLQGVDLTPAGQTPPLLPDLPRTLQMPRKRLIARSTVAWTREVQHEGRTFLLTDDFTWVPKDRVRPYDPVTFRGLWLGKEKNPASFERAKLPLAFFRGEENTAYRKLKDGSFQKTERTYQHLSWTSLTGQQTRWERTLFHETRDGAWVNETDAVVPQPREQTPWGAPVFDKDETEEQPRGRQTWVDVSILGGWLLAYEGTEPVFATMISPGRGGPPHGKTPPLETSSTPTGRFKITGKFVVSTMVAPNELVHSAVPWAQNFSGPFALHAAYWHNDWGTPKSGGCINLSPEDGRFMFGFTEPVIPEGWHGVRWVPSKEPATTLLVRR